MRLLLPSVTFAQERAAVAEAERVIVTGSNIPTAEEVGRTRWIPIARKTSRN